MARKVLLPRRIDGRLVGLTRLVQEVNGIFLYQMQGDYCPIEALFITGVESIGHVQAQSDRMEVVNEFFRRNPCYQFIKFHTHSRGTIERFEEHTDCE